MGLDFLKAVEPKTNIPWFAIGGINSINLSEVKQAGARRIALINAIMEAEDPYSKSKELLEKLQ